MRIRMTMIICALLCCADILYAYETDKNLQSVAAMIGENDALLVADSAGNILLSKHVDKTLAPASTFKLLTSLAAIRYLGPEYRFKTEFYIDNNANLFIKGFGDPMLVSEVLPEISRALFQTLFHIFGKNMEIHDIVLDNSYFNSVAVPGVLTSLNPYDATNGALCVNFNTVFFKKNKSGYESAEPQTPMIPFAIEKIKTLHVKGGRITFSTENNETALYAGHLFKYFLENHGFTIKGSIRMGVVNDSHTLVLTYTSPYTLQDAIVKLLEYSNNFIANQIFLAIGASVYGSPATLEKGSAAVSEYAKNVLKSDKIQVVEGSGIARENRISAADMLKILNEFKPYQHLMHKEDRAIFKTGTLSDVSTRAGYIEDGSGKQYSFVIFCNTFGKSAKSILEKLLKVL